MKFLLIQTLLFVTLAEFVLAEIRISHPQDHFIPPSNSVTDSLRSDNASERVAAATAILKKRHSLITELSAIVADQNATKDLAARWWGAKHLAIMALGDLRAEEAIPVLFGDLSYEVKVLVGGYGDAEHVEKKYPSVGSLVKIGKPASRRALETLESSDEKLVRKLSVHVLKRIEGASLARSLLHAKLKATESENSKMRLQAALDLLGSE